MSNGHRSSPREPRTHDERVLQLLADGQPHNHRELYGLGVIAHSRIASLRKKGHTIVAWRVGDDYLYQLTGSLLNAQPDRGLLGDVTMGTGCALSGGPTPAPSAFRGTVCASVGTTLGAAQLTLDVAG